MKTKLKKLIIEIEDKIAQDIEGISDYIFNNPELGGKEYKTSEFLVDILRQYGFRVQYPYVDIPTAFRAEIGNDDSPTFAFFAEYDALPNMGENGEPAHACGHNWISATSVGAGLVMSKLIKNLKGKIVVFGTPAEESTGYKVDMVNKGAFADVDAGLQLHLENVNLMNIKTLALDALRFNFTGKAAHAAGLPHEGINALDAVQLTFAGINALRQHLKSDVRVHGIVTEGGDAPNIVPDKCSCKFYVRGNNREYLNTVTKKVINCAHGAALMTGASLTVRYFENSLDDMVINPVLTQVAERNLLESGFSDFQERDMSPGSSDLGNVSRVIPIAYGYIDIGPRVKLHEREFVEYANGTEAKERAHRAVKGMACTALEVMTQPGLLKEIRSAFDKNIIATRNSVKHQSPASVLLHALD